MSLNLLNLFAPDVRLIAKILTYNRRTKQFSLNSVLYRATTIVTSQYTYKSSSNNNSKQSLLMTAAPCAHTDRLFMQC